MINNTGYNPNNFQNSALQKKSYSMQNFSAHTKNNVQQQNAEVSNEQEKPKKENILYRGLRFLGKEDPAKYLKALGMAAIATVTLMVAGNKLASPTFRAGLKIDKIFKSTDNLIGKCYQDAAGLLKKGVKTLSEKTSNIGIVSNIKGALNNKTGPRWNVFRGFENGAFGIFANTVKEIVSTALSKNKDGVLDAFNHLLEEDDVAKLFKSVVDPQKVAEAFNDAKLDKTVVSSLVEAAKKGDEALKVAFKNLPEAKQYEDIFKKLLNDNNYRKFIIAEDDSVKFANALFEGIKNKKQFGIKSKHDLGEFLANPETWMKKKNCSDEKIKETMEALEALKGIKMDQGGFLGSWWPANFVDGIYSKITGGKHIAICQGDLFDSMRKYGAIKGKTADTLPGRIMQMITTLPTEQRSNFVNDKSGFGMLICATSLASEYEDIIDAPKKERPKMILNSIITGSLSWLVAMPLAFNTVYGLAALRNLDTGKGVLNAIARGVGKVAGLGLDGLNKPIPLKGNKLDKFRKFANISGGIKGIAGGIGRFFAVMGVSGFVGGKIDKACQKIYGKPYNVAEAKQQKQLEEAKKQIIPELGVSQLELEEKMAQHPEIIQKLQTDPQMLEEMQKNPKIILDWLGIKSGNSTANTPSTSSAVLNYINSKKQQPQNTPASVQPNLQPNGQLNMFPNNQQTVNPSQAQNKPVSRDSATYIPSSQNSVKTNSSLSDAKRSEYNEVLAKADKALQRAQQYI